MNKGESVWEGGCEQLTCCLVLLGSHCGKVGVNKEVGMGRWE